MSLTVTETGTSFKSVEEGTYPARCIKLIDIGCQHSEYQGKSMVKNQVIVTWELPSEIIQDGEYQGQPYAVSKFYTLSLNEKSNLRKDLETWRGKTFTEEELKGFDLRKILGQPCMISVGKNDKGKTKVNAVMKLPKGMTVPDQINPSVHFDIAEWDEEKFNGLSDGIKRLICQSDEYQEIVSKSMNGTKTMTAQEVADSDIPF